jgi:hypothetical protein
VVVAAAWGRRLLLLLLLVGAVAAATAAALGKDVYVIIKASQLTIQTRKHFVPHREWTLHPTKIGVTLSLYE